MSIYLRPHQINFMDDGFSADFPKKMERAKKRQFFFFFLIFSAKIGRAEIFFFQRKKRKIDMIFRWGKKLVSPDKNEAAK